MIENTNAPTEIETEVVDNTATEPVRDAEAVLKKNRELLAQNAKLKQMLEGIDIEKARTAMEELRAIEEERLQKKGEYDKLIETKTKAYEERLDTERRRSQQFESTLKHEKLALALIERGVLPDRANYLVKELFEQVDLDYTESGFALKKRGGIGDAAEFNALVEEVKAKSPFFFAANITGGTGGSGSVTNGAAGTRSWSDLNGAEKAAAIRESGGDIELAKKKFR